MKSFWGKLNKPFFALAPMYDVTDAPFRAMFAKYSKKAKAKEVPDLVLFTEFVSCDGLASEEGRSKLLRELYYTEAERPIVAQVFGARPGNMEKAARLISELGFDGLDLNMGCPDKAIEKQGAGAALLKDPILAREVVAAAKQGAGDLPVSVKIRLGYNKLDLVWLEKIIATKPAALTVHLRTRKEMSLVPARWSDFPPIVTLAHEAGLVVVGNGDVVGIADGQQKANASGADGIMIGRGAFGRPWLFSGGEEPALKEKLKILQEQTELFWDLYGPTETNKKLFAGHQKNFAVMKKHFKAYVSGFAGASNLRAKLMAAENPEAVKKIIREAEKEGLGCLV